MKGKKMFKRLCSFAIVLIMAMSFVPFSNNSYSAKADDGTESVEVTVNYFRYQEDYTSWTVWMWADGSVDGASYSFTKDTSYGKSLTATFAVDPTTQGIGFIVRYGNWVSKDVDSDRFIPYSAVTNGKVEIFLLEGDETIYYAEQDVDKSTKYVMATFDNMTTIRATLTGGLTGEMVEDTFLLVNDERITPKTTTLKEGNKYIKFELNDSMSFSNSYVISSASLGDINVAIDKLFSEQGFIDEYTYSGELGAIYSKDSTTFKVWAPTASKVVLNRYQEGSGSNLIDSNEMTLGEYGVYSKKISGDINGEYYTYSVTVDGSTNEVVDPYAKSAGVNGNRGMIIDLSAQNPEGWEEQNIPTHENLTDSIIYEAHIRDLTIDESSGVDSAYRGKFMGMTQTGTTNSAGQSTALDHLVELGVTDLHILPSFDYASVDESKPDVAQFNWGYDPKNYNVLEGSYSTDAEHGEVRVNEFKQMVMALHNNNIRVVMDVVYNHTYTSSDSFFNQLVPSYYYRMNEDGSFSNGSGCGNETASEREMYRKFMIDSVVFYATEYKIDGFRFDLMGLHDIVTMNMIAEALKAVNPNIIIYGEGWTGGDSTLDESLRAMKVNAKQMPDIAMFSDDIRDAVKGSVFDEGGKGFIQGANDQEEGIKFGIVGATAHPQVSGSSWASNPTQTINYISAHDNLTLDDKLSLSSSESREERTKMTMLGASIYMTSQGIPFFQAGEEMLRSKPTADGGYDENSYSSPDSTNAIDWDLKTENENVFNFYKSLIELRKAMPEFRMATGTDVLNNIQFYDMEVSNMVGYRIMFTDENGVETETSVYYNANSNDQQVVLKSYDYTVHLDGDSVSVEGLSTVSNVAVVQGRSALIVKREVASSTTSQSTSNKTSGCSAFTLSHAGMALSMVLMGAVCLGLLKSKKH